MKGPRYERGYEDRGLDCQMDMESDFSVLVDAAMANGWSHVEALNGLFELARNHLIMCQVLDEEQRHILQRLKDLETTNSSRKRHN